MKSIIIGGGKIGYNLLKTMKERGFNPTLIEIKESYCLKIADKIGGDVICGDGTELSVLRDAGIGKAEVVAAVTGKDEENLVICEIAKTVFNVGKTIARINNPKNISMFNALGVDQTVCSTEVIANLIEFEFDRELCKVVQTFEKGAMVLIEVIITKSNPWVDSYVKNISLPSECVIASVLREGKVIYPRGDTQILNNDELLLITNRKTFLEIRKMLHFGGIRRENQ
jgi:trk system potassium uptake protein TrkA